MGKRGIVQAALCMLMCMQSAHARKNVPLASPSVSALTSATQPAFPSQRATLASSSSSSSSRYYSNSRRTWGIKRGNEDDDKNVDLSATSLVSRGRYMRLYPMHQLLGIRRPNDGTSWTTVLVLANIVAFFFQSARPGFTQWGMKYSDRILRGEELYRLFTPMFLHGNLPHLMMNMYSLTSMGPNVERLFGAGRFLSMYITAGVAGNIFSTLYVPNPSLGASGAVFGVLGAYFTFLARNEHLFGRYSEVMTTRLLQTVGINVFYGFINPGIDNWAHFGGFVGGAAMAYFFGPRLQAFRLPNGTTGLVDDPIMRLPRPIESLPEKVGSTFTTMKEKITGPAPLPSEIDQQTRWKDKPTNRFQRRQAPSRSIRPSRR